METRKETLIKNELFEKNYEIINTLKIDENVKKQLFKINYSLYDFATDFNLREKISIFIENIEQSQIDLIIYTLVNILKDYEIYEDQPNIIEEKYYRLNKNSLIIVNDYKYVEKSKSIDTLITDVIVSKSHLIMGKEDTYSEDFFEDINTDNRLIFRITGDNYLDTDILTKLKNKLKENKVKCNINDKEWLSIINTSLKTGECCRSNCTEYLFKRGLHQKLINNSNIIDKAYFNISSNEEVIKLNDLIGLENVKKEISSLKNYLGMQKRIGKVMESNYLNMLFLGNPGTGKTTVGRIYANILFELGYIKENKIVEIVPNDLMANYVGQTKDQTRKILNKAKGGVLFIDEAYLMTEVTYSDGFSSYMSEAIVELMKYMENPENVIIFAGYPIETRKIYDTNPGMKSRICKEIIFEDYTAEELYTILKNNLQKLGFNISKKGETHIKNKIKQEKQKKNFGNARFCHTLMQQILINYANRNTMSDTYLIIEDDVKFDDDVNFGIGFMEG